jgi:hypothetical protein
MVGEVFSSQARRICTWYSTIQMRQTPVYHEPGFYGEKYAEDAARISGSSHYMTPYTPRHQSDK